MTPALQRSSGTWFWALVTLLTAIDAAVLWRSLPMGILLTAALGVLALLATVLGTERGTLWLGIALIVVMFVLPGDLALRYRIPVGGGGVFIVDIIYALVMTSWILLILSQRSLRLPRSPVTLPLTLFVVWVVVASSLIGQQAGHLVKDILQDARGLSYYLLFIWASTVVRDPGGVKRILRVLAVCMGLGFAIGLYYYVLGQGMQLTYVDGGVSRFPAPNEVFVMGTTLVATMIVMWPSGSRRPWYLWLLLLVATLGVLLALVRSYWIGLAVGIVYLLVIVSTQQRVRLLGGGIALALILTAGLAVVQPTLLESIVMRAEAVTAYKSDPSVQFRLIENRAVERQIRERPWVGGGLGTTYLFDASRFGLAPYTKLYIHNNYLWLAQRLGLIGLALFFWMIGAFLFGWRSIRPLLARCDPWLGGVIVGSRVMIVTLLTISLTSPQFDDKGNVTVIAIVMALAEVARGSLSRESEAPSADGASLSLSRQTVVSEERSESA